MHLTDQALQAEHFLSKLSTDIESSYRNLCGMFEMFHLLRLRLSVAK
jgi:hypothetical protein